VTIPKLSRATTIARRPADRPAPIAARQVDLVRRTIAAIDAQEVRAVMLEEYRHREQRQLERALQRGRPRPVQCFSCRRCWKARPSSICTRCGDDPVTRTAHMDATPSDRMRFDENYYGERVL
jgi:hypothetical protein